MKIKKLNNTLSENNKKNSTILYGCCCCCCCCILAPLGAIPSEAIIKKITKHKKPLKKLIWVNILYLVLGLLLLAGGLYLNEVNYCRSYFCNMPSLSLTAYVDIFVLSFVFFFIGLYSYSKKWLFNVSTKKRFFIVLLDVVLTLVFASAFSALTIYLMIVVFDMF